MKSSPEPIHSIKADYDRDRSPIDKLRRLSENPLIWPTLAVVMLTTFLLLSFYIRKIQHDQGITLAQVSALQMDLADLHSQLEDLQTLNVELSQQLSERENQIALFANAMRVIALEGTEDAPEARGTFYTGDATSLLVLQGLPPLPQRQTYELWLIPRDGEPIPAGLIHVEERGATTVNIDMAGKSQEFAAVGVSIEPAGGRPQPTGPIVLLGTVQVVGNR
jgi:hypothetical protein